jgi:hypothetical protein
VPFGKIRLSFFGVGEWKNHPEKLQKQTVDGMQGFRMVPGNPWELPVAGREPCSATSG